MSCSLSEVSESSIFSNIIRVISRGNSKFSINKTPKTCKASRRFDVLCFIYLTTDHRRFLLSHRQTTAVAFFLSAVFDLLWIKVTNSQLFFFRIAGQAELVLKKFLFVGGLKSGFWSQVGRQDKIQV